MNFPLMYTEMLSVSVAVLGLNSTQLPPHCSHGNTDSFHINKSFVKMQEGFFGFFYVVSLYRPRISWHRASSAVSKAVV